jgi:hypothetical protein
MVKAILISVKEDQHIATYKCLPEGIEEEQSPLNEGCSFYLELDLNKEEILSNSLKEMDSYASHAERKIYEIYKETGKIPESAVSMWY